MMKGIVFGVFDGFDFYHQEFIKNCASCVDELYVLVATDSHVREYKKKDPKFNQDIRMQEVQKFPYVKQVVLCDKKPGTFTQMELIDPDIILLGYDQDALEKSLQIWMDQNKKIIRTKKIQYIEEN